MLQRASILRSEGGYYYLHSPAARSTLPVDALFATLMAEWLKLGEGASFQAATAAFRVHRDVAGACQERVSAAEDLFRTLLDAHYLDNIDISSQMSGGVSAESVRTQLANVTQISFELTQRCNLKCTYCGYGQHYTGYEARSNQDLKFESATALLDYVMAARKSPLGASAGRPIDLVFYGGEPLLRFDLLDKIRAFSRRVERPDAPFTFRIVTNGVLLPRYIPYIVQHEIKLQISLDGDVIHNSHRVHGSGQSSHASVVAAIQTLRSCHQEFYDNHVSFNVVLHDRNPPADVLQFFDHEFGKLPSLSPLARHGLTDHSLLPIQTTIQDPSSASPPVKTTWFPRLPGDSELIDFVHKSTPHVYRDFNELLYGRVNRGRMPSALCAPFANKIFVTATGMLLPCERVDHAFALGHVHPSGVELDPDAIAQQYENFLCRAREVCSQCSMFSHCETCGLTAASNFSEFNCQSVDETKFSRHLERQITRLESEPALLGRISEEVVYERG